MAARNIEVVIKVRDNASKKLNELEKKVRKTGTAATAAKVNFKDFNRTLFATTAFIGTFVKTFSTLTKALELGSTLDRVDNQFERVLGPSSKMLANIRSFTDASVDSMEAMRAGIALSNSGVTSSSEDTAKLLAMSAVAARRAGLDTTDGLKRVTDFAKTGSVASLEFLNLIRTTNPAFTAQIELIKKAGGVLGGTLSIQQKLAIGMKALELASRGQMHGFRDLADVLKSSQDSWNMFKSSLGRFLGTALTPIIDKFSEFFYKLSDGLEDIRKNSKELKFLAKSLVFTTGSVLGLAGALGTLRLATMALNSLGFGLPKLIMTVGLLGSVFLGITSSADGFVNKLKLFGGFIEGIYQLVTSFDKNSGVGQIDARLKKLLKDNKIYEFAKIISRSVIFVKEGLNDLYKIVTKVATGVDNLFGSGFRKIIDYISEFNKPWDLALLSAENTYGRIAAIIGLIGGGFAIKKILGSALSKIPFIGGMFGGGKGPKGTPTDPIYTASIGGIGNKVTGMLGGGLFGKMTGGLGKKLSALLSPLLTIASKAFSSLPEKLGFLLGRSLKLLHTTVLGRLGLSAAVGVAIGKSANVAADKYTTQTNQYGQKSNAFERLIAKGFTHLPKSMGGISKDSYDDMYDPMKNAFANRKALFESGQKTNSVNVPEPDNTISYLDSIGSKMKELDTAEAKKMQLATEQALSSGSDGGATITDEEMNRLTNSFGRALDTSKVMSDIRENTKKDSFSPMNRRPL